MYPLLFVSISGIGSNQKIIVGFCPNNVQRYADRRGWGVVIWKEPEFIAFPAETRIDKTPSRRPGTSFPVGTTPVSYKAEDDFGNVAWCNFTVTVIQGRFVVSRSVSYSLCWNYCAINSIIYMNLMI